MHSELTHQCSQLHLAPCSHFPFNFFIFIPCRVAPSGATRRSKCRLSRLRSICPPAPAGLEAGARVHPRRVANCVWPMRPSGRSCVRSKRSAAWPALGVGILVSVVMTFTRPKVRREFALYRDEAWLLLELVRRPSAIQKRTKLSHLFLKRAPQQSERAIRENRIRPARHQAPVVRGLPHLVAHDGHRTRASFTRFKERWRPTSGKALVRTWPGGVPLSSNQALGEDDFAPKQGAPEALEHHRRRGE